MKTAMKILSGVFLALALCTAALGVGLSFRSIGAAPVLVGQPVEARSQAVAVMDAICGGDYATAGSLLYGRPELGIDREPADKVGKLLWRAYVDSMEYELSGDCFATDLGVAQKVRFTCLELDGITDGLGERAKTLLAQRVAQAENLSEIYDENMEYREDFVMQVLYDAASQALQENAQTKTVELTLNMVYDGQWWVKPEAALLEAISGGIGK